MAYAGRSLAAFVLGVAIAISFAMVVCFVIGFRLYFLRHPGPAIRGFGHDAFQRRITTEEEKA
ncbi:MAG: hypothetical protein CVV51_06055 [Spirochaetae bacterium HGW-Spirochaetae-7]|jgi:hypothetical protein|nr:MAG: hypothetical protein CVV51_06055 [Spirochaetae bacterium HGW-Spirochaetae-7]